MREVFKKSLVVSLLSVHFTSLAEQNSPSFADIETIVTTASRTKKRHFDLIGNTSIISKDAVATVNAEHLNQVLSLASGVWLSRGNGQESLLSLRSPVLTGAGSCAEFLMLENNISLRAPGFCNVNQLFDSHFEISDRIEVVKGNNSARYGSNAIHGVININNTLYASENQLTLDMGNDDFYRLNAKASNDFDNMQLGIGVTVTSDGGYQLSSGYQQQKLSVSAQHQLGNWQTTHHFSVTNLEQDTAGYLQQGENAYKDKSLLKINEFPDAYRDSVAMHYSMQNSAEINNALWQLTPYLRYTDMTFLMHFLPGTPIEENDHHSIGLQLSRYAEVTDALSLKLGSDLDFTQGSLQQYQTNDTISDSAFLRAVLPKGQHYDYTVNAKSYALYGQLDYQIAADQNAFLALRHDITEYDYDNALSTGNLKDDGTACGFGGCRYTRPANQTNRFNDTSYSLGYSLTLNDNTIVFAKLDNSFRAPHTAELYRLQNNQQQNDITSADANQQELGLRFQTETVFGELAFYHLTKKNAIYQDSDRHYLNGLSTQHQGLEFDLTWRLNDIFKTRLNSSYAKHTYENNPTNGQQLKGNEIDTSPRLIANLVLDWQIAQNITSQFELRHLDGYYLDDKNTQTYSGHTVSNLRAKWQINSNFSIAFAVLNVFDTRFAERADYAFGNHRYFIGEPRNASATLRYQF